jgi:hypothetical protein
MLAWTDEHGTTVPEALRVLATAAACDGTDPKGTFYLLKNGDVRATTRMPLFATTEAGLRALGRKAEVVEGAVPSKRDDVVGVVAGTASFDWGKSGSRILPGAIAEHLTSFGAHFGTPGQTKCVKFLLAGAAGTGGAVAEPFAIQHKFPVPWIHVHYARGCSMAEAMYQSVWGPYQYLVMGDPLARPFASFAKVEVKLPSTPQKGTVAVAAEVTPAAGRPVGRLELFVDGRFRGEGPPGEPVSLDTTTLEDGLHEVRVVAIEQDPVATRSFGAARLKVQNGTAKVVAKGPSRPVALASDVVVSGTASGATSVELRRGLQPLATVTPSGSSWKLTVPAASLGVGTVPLRAAATAKDGRVTLSDPFEVVVQP